jgi:hypothetical protein
MAMYSLSRNIALSMLIAGATSAATLATAPPYFNYMPASVVIGQTDFFSGLENRGGAAGANTLRSPGQVLIVNGRLLIADSLNNRVLVYNQIPDSNNASADVVIGQPDFVSVQPNQGLGRPTASTLSRPAGLASDGQRLFVLDRVNHRVLIYDRLPAANNARADLVIGQASMDSASFCGNSANKDAAGVSASCLSSGPTGLAYDPTSGKLLIYDSDNDRVLVYNRIPNVNGAAADVVIGQPDFTHNSTNQGGTVRANTLDLSTGAGLGVYNGKLLIADRSNQRVLVFNSIPTSNNAAADVVIGQADFTHNNANEGGGVSASALSEPRGAQVDSAGRLFVIDGGNARVLVFDHIPTNNHASADVVIGQPDFSSATPATSDRLLQTLPYDVAFFPEHLVVSDNANRVLIFNNNQTTLPAMTVDVKSMHFAGVRGATTLAPATSGQVFRITQLGAGTVTWTAKSNVPWLNVAPSTGSGPQDVTVTPRFADTLPAAAIISGTVTVTYSGSSSPPFVVPITLSLLTSSSAPFGVFDTPLDGSSNLQGSIALTGWALDDVEMDRVELWRTLQSGETTPPFASSRDDPRSGKVFIAVGTPISGSRPDVEALYPNMPMSERAGWGYLLLTWGLWNQGNGSYTFFAYAFDKEGKVTLIGQKTVGVNNNAANKPFGSIDTPGIGGRASGPNFGWGLTPKVNGVATCRIPNNGVQVSIDSGPLQPVVYGDARSDIAGAFPDFANSTAAGGHFEFDWSTLVNGTHTIGWLITDDCNRTDGVGSRFFTVRDQVFSDGAVTGILPTTNLRVDSDAAVTVAHGYGELPVIVNSAPGGVRAVEVKQGDRIEIRLPYGFERAYQEVDGHRRELPIGSAWDARSGIFSWQPAAGFLGTFRIVFTNDAERISIRVAVIPPVQ